MKDAFKGQNYKWKIAENYFSNKGKSNEGLTVQSKNDCFDFNHRENLMDYESAAEIFGAVLALLFLLYARNKMRSRKTLDHDSIPPIPDRKKPDLISRTAGGIFKVHRVVSNIFAVVVIVLVIGAAVFDSLTRIIVLSTVGLMLLIALIGKRIRSHKSKKTKPAPHVQIIE